MRLFLPGQRNCFATFEYSSQQRGKEFYNGRVGLGYTDSVTYGEDGALFFRIKANACTGLSRFSD